MQQTLPCCSLFSLAFIGIGDRTHLVGVSLKMLTSMISLLIPSLVRTMSAIMLARDSIISPS